VRLPGKGYHEIWAQAVDDKGNRLFTDADVKALGAKSSRALSRCVRAAQRLNGLTGADLEDLAKN
jgi:hypothetical protein